MTRTSDKLYLVDPPIPVLEPTGPRWVTPSTIEPGPQSPQSGPPDQRAVAPEPDGGAPSPALSPQSLFRTWLQTEIRNRLADTGVEIEDVAHHQYREAYFFKRGADVVRIDIGYKGNWTVGGVTCPRLDGFAEEIMTRIAGLSGQKPGTGTLSPASVGAPDRPFLRDFHDRLIAALSKKGITVDNLKEQQWSQRYILARGPDSVTVDIFYNGRNQLKRFMPINPSPSPTASLVDLQNDVMRILTVEVHP